jgi:hypothetical protein
MQFLYKKHFAFPLAKAELMVITFTTGYARQMWVLSITTAPMYWRIEYSLSIGNARPSPPKIREISIIRSALPNLEVSYCSANILAQKCYFRQYHDFVNVYILFRQSRSKGRKGKKMSRNRLLI